MNFPLPPISLYLSSSSLSPPPTLPRLHPHPSSCIATTSHTLIHSLHLHFHLPSISLLDTPSTFFLIHPRFYTSFPPPTSRLFHTHIFFFSQTHLPHERKCRGIITNMGISSSLSTTTTRRTVMERALPLSLLHC